MQWIPRGARALPGSVSKMKQHVKIIAISAFALERWGKKGGGGEGSSASWFCKQDAYDRGTECPRARRQSLLSCDTQVIIFGYFWYKKPFSSQLKRDPKYLLRENERKKDERELVKDRTRN